MNRRGIVVVVAALVLHLLLVLRQYPITVYLAGDVPMNGDVPRYFASTHGAAEAGGLYGYDANFMAGYPVGLWNSMGKKGFELAHYALPWIPLPRLFYLVLVGGALAAPLLLWGAVRAACGSRRCSFLALLLVLTLWHLSSRVAYFWGFGNIFFPATACLIIAACAALAGCLDGRRALPQALWLGLLMAAVGYFHPVLWVASLVPLAALAWWRRGPRLGWVLLSAALCVLLCLPWLIALWMYRDTALSQPKAWFQGGTKFLIMDWFGDRTYGQPFDRIILDRAVILAGLVGGALAWRDRRVRPLLPALALGGGGCLAIAYLGPYVPSVGAIQPYRFLIPATLFFLAPAALALDRAWEVARGSGRAAQVVMAGLCLLLLPEITAYGIDLVWGPAGTRLTPRDRAVYQRLRDLSPEGRVLCDDPHLAHLLPYHTGLEALGGLCSQAFVKHRFAGVDEDGIVFGQPAKALTPDGLARYLDLYAVELLVLTRAELRQLADRDPQRLERIGQEEGVILYRVRQPAGRTSEATAIVRRTAQRLQVERVAARSLLLKYHFADWMRADAGVALQPEVVADDPVPFIRAVLPPGVTAFQVMLQPE